MNVSDALRDGLISAAKSLAARPRELRGPFIVNHELVERIAALPSSLQGGKHG